MRLEVEYCCKGSEGCDRAHVNLSGLSSLPRIDLAVLLGKTPSSMENESTNLESSQAPSLAQPLVFSNSKQSAISQPASGNSFSHHSMVRKYSSLLGFGRCWFP